MIRLGDCVQVMAFMQPESVDSIVTDPPYGLEFMGKEWDRQWRYKRGDPNGKSAAFAYAAGDKTGGKGFAGTYGPEYSAGHSFQEWCTEWGREALRVTKPGGYLLAFGGTRTHHRLVCGLEDAGWIIRDELTWVYASGFPKGKANLKPAHEPIVLARKPGPLRPLAIDACRIKVTDGADLARMNKIGDNGWKNSSGGPNAAALVKQQQMIPNDGTDSINGSMTESLNAANGRWPSNLLLSDPDLFDVANPYVVGSGAVQQAQASGEVKRTTVQGFSTGKYSGAIGVGDHTYFEGVTDYGDAGGYSRFFRIPSSTEPIEPPTRAEWMTDQDWAEFQEWDRWNAERYGVHYERPTDSDDYPRYLILPKADRADREPVMASKKGRENQHPTVKPVDLMRHLVRLVTPPGGLVLDCFLGSGSTAIAAELEGFDWIGIEKEPDYVKIAEARLNGTQKGLGLAI